MPSELDRDRLTALADQLGETPEHVAATLHAELVAALRAIDEGLSRDELDALDHPVHAARNSALMIGAPAMLETLRALDTAVTAGDLPSARAVRERLRGPWGALSAQLRAVA